MTDNAALHQFSNKHLLRRCLQYFYPYWGRVLVAFISSIIVAPVTTLTLKIGQKVIDDVLVAKDIEMLKLSTFAVVALYSVEGVFRFLQSYLMNTTGLLVLNDLRAILYEKIVRLPAKYFEKSQVGMLMSRVVNDVSTMRMSAPSLIMAVREMLQTVFLIGYTFYVNAYLAAWTILIVPLVVYPVVYFGKKMRKLGRKGQAQLSDVNVRLDESFNGIRVIKAFASEQRESERFRGDNRRLTLTLFKQVMASELSSRVVELITALAGAGILWVGGLIVIDGKMSPGELFTFLGAFALAYQPIKKLNMCNMNLQQALAGAERVFDIFDSPHIRVEDSGDTVLDQPFRSLEFKDVEFTYDSGKTPALTDLNLVVEQGKRVAIVGPSGSGKTTLASLVPRFYDPTRGKLLLNGTDVRDYTLESLRLNMGIVTQESFLFNDTIRNNLQYAPGQFTEEQIVTAAKAAHAHEFIMEQPEGYDTVVGERGAKLSGGQKQRLTIARALLKNPPLLILDEATSALDTESERIVQSALDNLMAGRTSIVIAHRLSTVLTADSIVVMERGRAVAQGTHQELLAASPLYKKLYDMQFSDQTEG